MRIFLNILKSTVKYMKSKFLLIYGFKIPEIIKDKKKESEPIIEPKERFVNIEVEKLIDRLNSFKPVEETSKNPHEKELGEPDLIQKFEEDGYSYEKSIWYESVKIIRQTENHNWEKLFLEVELKLSDILKKNGNFKNILK